MNDFTLDLLSAAYQICLERNRGKVTPHKLRQQIDECWTDYRYLTIEGGAKQIMLDVPQDALAGQLPVVFTLLIDAGIEWERPETDERLEAAWATSWGLAVLWWLRREEQERIPIVQCTDDDIERWIASKGTGVFQLSFLGA